MILKSAFFVVLLLDQVILSQSGVAARLDTDKSRWKEKLSEMRGVIVKATADARNAQRFNLNILKDLYDKHFISLHVDFRIDYNNDKNKIVVDYADKWWHADALLYKLILREGDTVCIGIYENNSYYKINIANYDSSERLSLNFKTGYPRSEAKYIAAFGDVTVNEVFWYDYGQNGLIFDHKLTNRHRESGIIEIIGRVQPEKAKIAVKLQSHNNIVIGISFDLSKEKVFIESKNRNQEETFALKGEGSISIIIRYTAIEFQFAINDKINANNTKHSRDAKNINRLIISGDFILDNIITN